MSADFTPEKEDLKILTPFKMQVLTNFPYIEADFDALTNYQLLCKVVEYLNNTITEMNEVTEQTESLYNAYVSLQNYVNTEIGDFETTVNNRVDGLESYMNNYFNNLDVQQEINNKLDTMATDGTLTNLIKDYVDPIYQAYEERINEDIDNMEDIVSTFNTKVNSVVSGTPKGVYATVAALEAADPDHDYIYVVTETGNWYYYNGTAWTSGGTYQGTAVPDDDIARINKNYADLRNTEVSNLSDYYHIYISSSSPYSTGTSDTARTSEYLICQGYNKIEYKTYITDSAFEILFYNRNKELLPDISIPGNSSSAVKTINVPATAYYVRISVYGSSYIPVAYIKLYLENSAISKINNNTANISNNLNELNIIENMYNETKQYNILTLSLIYDGYVNYNNGAIVNAGDTTSDKNTGFIICKGYTKIRYKTYITDGGAEIAFYNKDKEYLQNISISGDSSTSIKTINVPDNAYYVIMSKYYSGGADFFITLYSDKYLYKSNLVDKNILIFGDSITDCANVSINDDYETSSYSWPSNPARKMWPWLINKHFYCKEVRNYALSGATYSKQSDYTNKRSSLIDQVQIAINDKNNPNNVFNQNTFNPDIIIFAAGTNQYSVGTYSTAMNKTIYESDDHTININSTLANLDQTKEIEAARYCFMKIKNEWPMAQIYVVLPIQRMSKNQIENNLNIELPKLAERYGAIIINGCDNGIVQEGNVYQGEGVTLVDGLHPNQNGQYLMTRQILKSIESNYFDYSIFS